MCIAKFDNRKCKMLDRRNIGRAVSDVLTQAKKECRLICGLLPAIAYLEKNPEDALLCFLPETNPGDAATHMQTVLLQAFCYENYIPVIQVNSSKRLAELCGIPRDKKTSPSECRCVIVTSGVEKEVLTAEDPPLTPEEQQLTDFYECTLEEFPRPVIQLPI